MFTKNYPAEHMLKTLANILLAVGFVMLGICVLTAFILLIVDADDLWWVSLITVGGGSVLLGAAYIGGMFLWSFGDVVGNTKRIAEGTKAEAPTDDVLPEL